ncbi:hypothetical protein BKP45_00585 [Anaerobacillus alkalidiazotrophicus]|uniref:Rubrerythrin diiron-binding domain-containing protein n=1 Tax=Anaerobacillus alkalidiazotrophicus TaxID=472963 RepID=A0A1S2MA03_9BACI|nr:ferritin-like domain-containing protein [Anaerobacillus alkalidiazotrophicus]OIJ21313.1 hypothetical protein BKP45_00585 [Anaerobacillus alkalidiazotrophicus]
MYYQNYFLRGTTSQDISILLTLIIEVVRHEAITELTFDYLKVIAQDQRDEKLLQSMLEDEREHFNELKKIYFSLTGKKAEGDPPQFEIPESYIAGIEGLYFQKLEILSIYKKMRNLSPYVYIRELVADFIHDELRHLTMLNHILINNCLKDRTFALYPSPIYQHDLFS